MKHLLMKTIAGSGLLLFALTGYAQPPRQDYPDRYQDRDRRGDPGHDRTFDRIRGDLERVLAETQPFTTDHDRLVEARLRLNECQRMVNDRNYDRRTFDFTVASVQRVVELNRLSERNHDYLTDDIQALRAIQAEVEQQR
jgi:hypothetical protein